MLRNAFTPAVQQTADTPASHIDKSVAFLHPGYSVGDNVLLRLPAPDGKHGGIDYDLALHACAILANNRFDGYFTDANVARDENHLRLPADQLIPPGDYFFNVPPTAGDEEPYAVPASFYDWEFPHASLPAKWRSQRSGSTTATVSNLRTPVAGLAERDRICRLSGCQEQVQQAHVVPESEWAWFASNGMRRYTVEGLRHGKELLSNIENKLLLRSDLHALWDNRAFVFVTKGSDTAHTVAHALQESTEVLALYHNRYTQPLYARRELLFARLAWAIFPFMRSFLNARQSRRVVLRKETGETIVKTMSADQCSTIIEQRKRSTSPKKRKAQDMTESPCELDDDSQLDTPLRADVYSSPGADSGYAAALPDGDDRVCSSDTVGKVNLCLNVKDGQQQGKDDTADDCEFRGRKRRRTAETVR